MLIRYQVRNPSALQCIKNLQQPSQQALRSRQQDRGHGTVHNIKTYQKMYNNLYGNATGITAKLFAPILKGLNSIKKFGGKPSVFEN